MATRINETPVEVSMVPLEFYRGIKEIAAFLGIHPKTAYLQIRQGLIPAKKDRAGRWVLCNLDYWRSLRETIG